MKGKLPASLNRHLLSWALGALVLVWGVFIVVGWRTGTHEADELTDGHLASVSALLLPLAPGGIEPDALPPRTDGELRAHDYQRSLTVVVWDAQGRVLSHAGDAPVPPFTLPDGFATVQLGSPARSWRTFSRWDPPHAVKLTVMLLAQERDELAAHIAEHVVVPGLWLLPAVALVLVLAIHRGLRPLRRLAEEVHALDAHNGQKVKAPARFRELDVAVDAINVLVDRYHVVLTRERALVNEFAHELRTPLASIALQARSAQDAPAGSAQQAALTRLGEEALRAGEVLAHLLALARASRADLEDAAQMLDLEDVARRVVADFAPHAHASGRELELSSPGPFPLSGHAVLLELALRNLVQNSLAHTPPGTRVEVELDPAAHVLQVSDDGQGRSGEPPAAGPHALQPLRLGLGHRVVEKVAALHGATFEPDVPLAEHRRGWRIRFAPPAEPDAALQV